jgi:hypothetical protein
MSATIPTGTRVKVTSSDGFSYIGTLVDMTPRRIEIIDATMHNPADPSVTPHKDNVRFAMFAVVSVTPVQEG